MRLPGPDIGDPCSAPPLPGALADEIGADPGRLRIAFTATAPTGAPVHHDCVAAGQTVAARPVPHGSALLMNPAHVHLMLNHFSIIGSIFGLVLLAVAMVRNSRELITVSLACLASVAIISVAALLANNRSSFRRVVFTLQHAAAIRDHAYC
jgi:hypothetical protein